MKLDDITNDQFGDALQAAVAKAIDPQGMSMRNYHVLSTQDDNDPIAEEDLCIIGGDDADEFYSVPIDLSVLRSELAKLIASA